MRGMFGYFVTAKIRDGAQPGAQTHRPYSILNFALAETIWPDATKVRREASGRDGD